MNLVNTYLLLPLQRRIFKNFGYYDYQTSTFYLNEERVNEVFFDPAFNPFMDVLRETAHASAVASSKSVVQHVSPSPPPPPSKGAAQLGSESQPAERPGGATPSSSSPVQGATGCSTLNAGSSLSPPTPAGTAVPTDAQPPRPCVQLLRGKIRSAGLLSFLRRATTQKSLAVESIDMVFSIAAACAETSVSSDFTSPPAAATDGRGSCSSPSPPQSASPLSSNDAHILSNDQVAEGTSAAVMARSCSLEDHLSLFTSQLDPLHRASAAVAADASDPSTTTPSRFRTVGDLMQYLKSQLQGLTVSVEEMRLTFCVPPAAASLSRPSSSAATTITKATTTTANATSKAPVLRRGTRVVHFCCRRGLRFSVDETVDSGGNGSASALEDMRCSVVINDWQCYLHVMADDDGPVPTDFSLDELIMTTTADVGAAAAAAAATSTPSTASSLRKPDDDTGRQQTTTAELDGAALSVPLTVHLARRSALPTPSQCKSVAGASIAAPLMGQPTILLDAEAAGGWSVVLTAAQVAHFADMAQLITAAMSTSGHVDVGEGVTGASTATATSSCTAATPPPSLSSRWDAEATDRLQRQVDAAPLEYGEAVAAAALVATQLQSAAKYVSLRSAGCSVTLLTQPVVEPGVVAQAWRGALPAQQLSLLMGPESGIGSVAVEVGQRCPVFEGLATPHFTYVMRDVDVLFPNIEAGGTASPSSLPNRVFAADRKKRAIYRNLFKNNLVDPVVTEQLVRAQQRGCHGGAQCFFLGVGTIALLEYRRAAAAASKALRISRYSSGQTPHLLRPAQLLHAERSPYALIVFHRTTTALPEMAGGHPSPSPPGPTLPANPASQASLLSPLQAHRETVVVGLASIALQVDPELAEVLTSYAFTLTGLTGTITSAKTPKSATAVPTSEAPNPVPPRTVATAAVVPVRSSIKVLLENLEASVRFPLYPLATREPSTAALPSLLARLLQRLRDTSLHTHGRLRTELLELTTCGNQKTGQCVPSSPLAAESKVHATSTATPERATNGTATAEVVNRARALSAVQAKLGFPEDASGMARFLPEFLRFSILDLQLVQTQAFCDARASSVVAPTAGAAMNEPLCASIKWRESVVYMHDVLEETKSELCRVDYSPEMNIRVTHTRLPDEVMMGPWQALGAVLLLQIRLGDITTTVLTQDDFLLASYYTRELLQAFAQCRQRWHTLFGAEAATVSAGHVPSTQEALQKAVNSIGKAYVAPGKESEGAGECPLVAGAFGTPPDAQGDATIGRRNYHSATTSELPSHLSDAAVSTVAEAFAFVDARNSSMRGTTIALPRDGGDDDDDACTEAQTSVGAGGVSPHATNPQLPCDAELLRLVPGLWRYRESTCTAFDVQLGRVRLGLFAPRLSPMGNVVGEPLFRCLPAAQRRQLVDLNCLYHTYVVEVAAVSICGLQGNGGLVGEGHDTYLRTRLGSLAVWERQPFALSVGGAASGISGTAAASSSLYSSYVLSAAQRRNSASSSPSPTGADAQRPHHTPQESDHGGNQPLPRESIGVGSGPGSRRDVGYYLSNQQHRSGDSALVQLVQSYSEMKGTAEDGEEGKGATRNGGDGSVRGALNPDERFLCEVWGFYVRELETRLPEDVLTVAGDGPSASCGDADLGVCELRLLEYAPGTKEAEPLPSALRTARDTRYVKVQLTGLGLHHTVAYNGDHLAAVLKNYFYAGECRTVDVTTADVTASPYPPETELTTESVGGGTTVAHLELVNLMATYRPRGVGRSLVVALLPRASVLVRVPASAPAPAPIPPLRSPSLQQHQITEYGATGGGLDKGKGGGKPAPQVQLAMQAQAWLHTALSVYICNDCDVEALAREVLDPTESDDWGADLEWAGFVRLCEVVSTAPPAPETRTQGPGQDASAPFSSGPAPQLYRRVRREPNVTVTLPQPETTTTAAMLPSEMTFGNTNDDRDGVADNEDGANVNSESAVSVRSRYLELSAFMAKDAFDVLRELLETWAAGTDLKVLDTPAALVMRSGPGFEWVAEEVARSCAPMTFRLNPALTSAAEADQAMTLRWPDCEGEGKRALHNHHIGDAAGGAAPSYPPASSTVLQSSYTTTTTSSSSSSSSPLHCRAAVLQTGSLAGEAEAPGDVSSITPPTYGYSSWRATLHAAQGVDEALMDAYQARVAALLDRKAAWVPVRPLASQSTGKDDCSANTGTRLSGAITAAVAPEASNVAALRQCSPSQRTCQRHTTAHESASASSDEFNAERAMAARLSAPEVNSSARSHVHPAAARRHLSDPSAGGADAGVLSVSSSFSDLSDLEALLAPVQWHVVSSSDPQPDFSEMVRRIPAAALVDRAFGIVATNVAVEDDEVNLNVDGSFDLCAACEHQPHFFSYWSRDRADPASPSCPVSLHRLERTDDALLHHSTEKYLYPPFELQFFLCDCAANVCLYEGTDLTAAAVRKQRQGYLQIVSRGAHAAHASTPYFSIKGAGSGVKGGESRKAVNAATQDTHRTLLQREGIGGALLAGEEGAAVQDTCDPPLPPCVSQRSRTTAATGVALDPPSESSASCLSRLNSRGCRSGFGDRDASKRLVLSCRRITVQLNTFPEAAEEDLWFHLVIGEATVFDCIETSDVHRLLTATPRPTSVTAAMKTGVRNASYSAAAQHEVLAEGGGGKNTRQVELTGLLTSSKSVRAASSASLKRTGDDAHASFTVSHFQQGGGELSVVVRLQPMSLTWSGASVDFAQSFFFSSSSPASSSPSPAPSVGNGGAAGASLPSSSGAAPKAAAVLRGDEGVISGTEAPPVFFRRVVVLPTTLHVAGSFQSDKGVLAALAEGRSLDALRSVPVLSWISLQEIPLSIPFMCIEDCSNAAALMQRIVEDSNCVSIRFLLTALCCGLQPLSAVARVGEAAKGLLLLPLSQYHGAALHHAIRTASSRFMQELLTQTSGVAALLASGSYHASRSLFEVLVSPSERRLAATAEPSRALQPVGVADGWRQGQEQLRSGLEEALTMASYCTGPDGSLLRLPAAALRMLMGVSGAATTALWGVRNSQSSTVRDRDGYIYKK